MLLSGPGYAVLVTAGPLHPCARTPALPAGFRPLPALSRGSSYVPTHVTRVGWSGIAWNRISFNHRSRELSTVRRYLWINACVSGAVTRLLIMNREKAEQVLHDYWEALKRANLTRWLSPERSDPVAALNSKLPAVNIILRDLAPDLPLIKASNLGQHRSVRPILEKAWAILTKWKMLDQARIGERPALPLTMLDPVIADAALPLWEVGKYRQAVNDAARSLNVFAQQRLGRRDISDKKLMADAFSDKPPEVGKARRRCYRLARPMESVHSQQEGAQLFAMGTFGAIRNPAHHVTGDWNPLTAFHHLVALSQVAHYFRDWKIETPGTW